MNLLGRSLTRVRTSLGIDKSIGLVLASRSWTLLSGPLTLFFIGRFLSPPEQGFYYTFSSVIAINTLLELGLSTVLIQFASHEMAHLHWNDSTIVGSARSKSRLAAVFKESVRWYAAVALLVCLVTFPAGVIFFERTAPTQAHIHWAAPWCLLAAASAFNLALIPVFAIMEGSGKVSSVISIQVCQNVFAGISLWIALSLNLGLFSAGIYQTVAVLTAVIALKIRFGNCLRDLGNSRSEAGVFCWWTELWPFQWRIAISWLSGYFMFQLFNPVSTLR